MKEKVSELKEYGIPELEAYEIVGYIGRGAWTPVFKARRKTDGSLWALKFYRPDEQGMKNVEEGGWTEDDYWTKGSQNGQIPLHQNIAFNFVDKAPNGERFLAEKYLGERFLNQYLEEVGTPLLEEIINISRGMASALEVQHTQAGGEGRAHGDFAPKNIGYSLDKIVQLSDFGTSTIGDHKIGGRGYLFIRAVEGFPLTQEPTKKGDVFSFGSTLYKLFTGEYIFEREIKQFENPAEFMSYLEKDTDIWNKTIDKKVKDVRIPKQFRKFLRRTMYNPKDRIKDGVELAKELDKAVKKYEKSKTRWRRYGIAAAALLALGIGAGVGINALEGRFDEYRTKVELEKKVKVLKLYEADAKSLSNDWDLMVSYGEFKGFQHALKKDGITDPKMHYLVYFDPEIAYEAMQATGARDFEGVLGYLLDNGYNDLFGLVYSIEGGGGDNISRLRSSDKSLEAQERWQEIKKKYEEKKRLEREREKFSKEGFPPRGHNFGYR